MRKLFSLLLAVALSFCMIVALAEQDNFLVSDWTLSYAYGDSTIAEQTIFIYEDGTFEAMVENDSATGTWTFDGETLALTGGDETISLVWNEEAHQFSGEYSGLTLTMFVPIEPEEETADSEEAMSIPELAGGWTVAEDPAITEEISSLFWNGMDSYQTGMITVSYTPVAYLGWQVVAGSNHAILCRSQEINHPAVWVIVYLYVDMEGNASVLNIAELPLGV